MEGPESLGEAFWEQDGPSALNQRTVLGHVRRELSADREEPISLQEAFRLAEELLGLQCPIFEKQEVARPLLMLLHLWALKVHRIPRNKAYALATFVASYAGSDAILSYQTGPTELKLERLLLKMLHGRYELTPAETTHFLREAVRMLAP